MHVVRTLTQCAPSCVLLLAACGPSSSAQSSSVPDATDAGGNSDVADASSDDGMLERPDYGLRPLDCPPADYVVTIELPVGEKKEFRHDCSVFLGYPNDVPVAFRFHGRTTHDHVMACSANERGGLTEYVLLYGSSPSTWGIAFTARADSGISWDRPATVTVSRWEQIGRASCRERV